MKKTLVITILAALALSYQCSKSPYQNHSVSIVTKESERKSDIIIDGRLFTSFCWPENVYKPILYPVLTAAGTEVTRGFPLKPRKGEQVDHLHQVGIWLTYGKVNKIDFWGNGYRGMKEPTGGEIKHISTDRIESRKGEGIIRSNEEWIIPGGKKLLAEKSEYHFMADDSVRIIDRVTTLTANDTAVVFKDTKEGMFGFRVARQLEMPSKEGVILIDSTGHPSAVRDTLNTGVSGNYNSSEGINGEGVWGTRARCMNLAGKIGSEKISITICDHPKNPGFPTYWHARGYGLFAANPFGWKDFTKGKSEFNYSIPAGKSATFRYRVIISSGHHLNDNEINKYYTEFAGRYR